MVSGGIVISEVSGTSLRRQLPTRSRYDGMLRALIWEAGKMRFRFRGPRFMWALLGAVLGLFSIMPAHAAEEKHTTNPPIDKVVKTVNAEQDEELYRPTLFAVFLISVSHYVIRRLTDRRRARDVGKMRQMMCALFGAVVGPIFIFIFVPVTPTLGRVAAPAVIGAASALMIGNSEALALRLSRTMLQIMWALFGAVCGVVWASSVKPTLEYLVTCTVIFAVIALVVGNCEALALRLGSVLSSIPARCLGLRRAHPDYDGAALGDGPSGDWLAGMVSELRKRNKLVGLAARVMVDGHVMASAADGERKRGSGVPIGLGDRWHLGSITKSITATMIARLVESGQMQWSDSIGGRFTDASIHEDWKPVTLRQLLTHSAGAPGNFSLRVRLIRPSLGPECTKERRQAVMS